MTLVEKEKKIQTSMFFLWLTERESRGQNPGGNENVQIKGHDGQLK